MTIERNALVTSTSQSGRYHTMVYRVERLFDGDRRAGCRHIGNIEQGQFRSQPSQYQGVTHHMVSSLREYR